MHVVRESLVYKMNLSNERQPRRNNREDLARWEYRGARSRNEGCRAKRSPKSRMTLDVPCIPRGSSKGHALLPRYSRQIRRSSGSSSLASLPLRFSLVFFLIFFYSDSRLHPPVDRTLDLVGEGISSSIVTSAVVCGY